MGTLTRKQREIAERDARILDVARALLLERGYPGLTMDRIAQAIEYSKGTVYQHYKNKEEVVVALALQNAEKRLALFDRAATFRGRPRERMAAVGIAEQLFVRLYPAHFASERIVDANDIRQKASAAAVSALEDCDFRCMGVLQGLIRDAAAQGDLEFDDPEVPAQVSFGLWGMSYGAHLLLENPSTDVGSKLGVAEPTELLFANYSRLLDGYGWKPLSDEWDYDETRQRILREVFVEEAREAGLL